MRVLNLFMILAFVLGLNASELRVDKSLHLSDGKVESDFSVSKYPINGVHKKLDLSCNDCHKESSPKEYSSAMLSACLNCHKSYEKLAEYTGALGHNDNIHASPHYETLACDTCHKAHKPSVNMCVRCHTQDSLKSLVVK